jgi:hypothetical protein
MDPILVTDDQQPTTLQAEDVLEFTYSAGSKPSLVLRRGHGELTFDPPIHMNLCFLDGDMQHGFEITRSRVHEFCSFLAAGLGLKAVFQGGCHDRTFEYTFVLRKI